MIKNRNVELIAATLFVLPFALIYLVIFIYPSAKMVAMSFTDAPLIGPGNWIGFDNFQTLFRDRLFWTSVENTFYFVALTVVPNTLLGLAIALMVSRLQGWRQSAVLAVFFLPYVLPVSVVYSIWNWMFDPQYGVAQFPIEAMVGSRISVFRTPVLFLPVVALVTIWWSCGFNVLLFLAGLRSISQDIYEAASLDDAGRWTQFKRITWPLIWPVTALVLTIQLILQLKIFDQVYLFSQRGQSDPTLVMVQFIFREAFQQNRGGYGATIALALFVIIVALSALQQVVLGARGADR